MNLMTIALAGFIAGTLLGYTLRDPIIIERDSECVPTSMREVASLRVSDAGTLVCSIRPVKGYGEA